MRRAHKILPDPIDPVSETPIDKTEVDPELLHQSARKEVSMENKTKEFTLNPYTVIGAIILAVTIAYHVPSHKLGREIEALTDDVAFMVKENTKLTEFKTLADQVIDEANLTLDVDEEVTDWAYRHAKNWIPRSTIVDIVRECSKYDNYYMLLSIIKEESNFYVYAKSDKDAKGLAQIQTKWWGEELIAAGIWNEELDVFDYRKNIAGANYIINKYYKQTGTWEETLLKYVNNDPVYVEKVLSNYGHLRLTTGE